MTDYKPTRKHLKLIQPKVDDGFLVLGGATLDSHPSEGETPKMNGSVMIFVGESEDDVLTMLKNDIYNTSGVWNLEKVCTYIAVA